MTEGYAERIAFILDVSIDILSGKDLKQEFLKLLDENSVPCLNK